MNPQQGNSGNVFAAGPGCHYCGCNRPDANDSDLNRLGDGWDDGCNRGTGGRATRWRGCRGYRSQET